EKHVLRPVAWSAGLVWVFFAIGPGAVIGNDLFGAPNGGTAAWRLGLPPIWAWQLAWWALGVLMIWFLAYKMELSTAPSRTVEFHAARGEAPPLVRGTLAGQWQPWFWTASMGAALLVVIHWMFG
ncbi:MAG TPA: hypothetical protein VLX85_03110, partial [Stellaceae bacterium]|nr:hypothetical protein [Stellaceae bacterium]